MNFPLLAKELRALRPMAWCIGGLCAFGTLYLLITELPDAQPLSPAIWLAETRDGTFVILALFSLMIGAGLLVQESEQGTLHFLDGLPLSRARIFGAKTCAGLLVLAWVPLLGLVTDVAFGLLSRTSLDEPFPWKFCFVVAGLQMVAGAWLLALAMVISFARSWFVLVAGLVFWGYLWLRQGDAHWVALLDSHALLAPDIAGGAVGLPWPAMAAHLGATLALLVAAWLGFGQLGDGAQRAADRVRRVRMLRALGSGLKLLAPIVWLAALVRLAGALEDDETKDPKIPVGEESFARRETKHYEFLLRSVQLEKARDLLRAADAVHDQVAAFLGATAPPARIVVDLASPVMPHAAGQANWTKIRMPLKAGQNLDEQRLILGHETAHVFIEQLGGGRLSAHFSSIRCLHEGLATHVELELLSTPERQAQHRRAVAGAWSRGKVPLALLADDSELGRQRDPNLAYPLGAELVRALLATQGRNSAARLLRAIARQDVRAKSTGATFWREVMQDAGLEFERVAAVYETACAASVEQEKDFLAGLPRLSAKVTFEPGNIVVRPKFEGAAPGEIVCVVEGDELLGWPTQDLPVRDDGTFVMSRERYAKSSLRYLLGWRTGQTTLPVFEPWTEAAAAR